MLNKFIGIGRLTKDPELSQTPNGVSVAKFTIAVNRRFAKEGQQQADFINCVAWRATADFICKWFSKGSSIAVVGSIQTRSWDGQDGKKNYATEVIVDEAYFAGSKSDNSTAPQKPETMADDFSAMGFSEVPDDGDLPF